MNKKSDVVFEGKVEPVLYNRQQAMDYMGIGLSTLIHIEKEIGVVRIAERRVAYRKIDIDRWIKNHIEERKSK